MMDKEKPDVGPIPINDSEVNPQEIMAEIRSKLIESSHNIPDKQLQTYPEKPYDIPYDLELYQRLEQLKEEYKLTGTELDVRESGISHLPLIGRLWQKIQRALHGPGHYYTNRAADRQAEINGQIFQILSMLMAANQERQREIIRLREELIQLREDDR